MIPRILHLCWISGDPYPELIDRCIATWKAKLPSYEIMLWDRNSAEVMTVPWVAQAVAQRKYAFAADYIRLYALHSFGGIYLDADVEIIRSLDPLLNQPSFLGYDDAGDLELAIIGATAGCDWIQSCLNYYRQRQFIGPEGDLDMKPLPLIVAEILRRSYDLRPGIVNEPEHLASAGLTLYPSRYFSPKNVHTGRLHLAPDSYAIHHFDGQWLQKDWRFHLKAALHASLAACLGKSLHRRLIDFVRQRSL